MSKRILLLVTGAIMLVAVLSGCAVQSGEVQASAAVQTYEPQERTIYMAAVEPKGGVTIDREPFPDITLPEGGGYILKEPDENGRWEVATYHWSPGTIVVYQGDLVTLEIVGINGAVHPLRIEGYDDVHDVVQRGHITRVTFTADKAGIFKIICDAHLPAMQADLVVLPTG